MNYQRIYDELIAYAQARTLDGSIYVEKHHIIPKCLAGSNKKENLVKLTPEEHYVAHQLLAKLYPNNPGLIYACIAMTGNPNLKRGSKKAYGWIRRKVSEFRKDQIISEETRQKHSETNKRIGHRPPDPTGRIHSEEARKNMSIAQKKVVKSETDIERLRKLSQARIGTKASEETREKLSKASKGKKKSREHCRNIAAGLRGKKYSEERIKNMVEGKKLAKENREKNLEAHLH